MPRHAGTHRFDGLKIGQANIQSVLDGYQNQLGPTIDGYARNSTKEELTFNVDYNLAGAVRTPGYTIVRQSEIDGYLEAAGTTAFQYLQDVWEALPTYIAHNVTINLASGIHRPRNPEPNSAAWTLTNKQTMGSTVIVIQGSDGYTTLQPFISITAIQAASNDPWIDVTGAPYVVDGYRGLFALLSTGQRTVIHDNTANRLFFTNNISPTNPTSVLIYRPGTILRNSYTDTTSVKGTGISVGGGNNTTCRVLFNDIQLDTFNITFGFLTSTGGSVTATRFLLDHAYVKDTFGVSSTGRGFQPSDSLVLNTSSMRGTNIAAVPTSSSGDAVFMATGGKTLSLTNSYVGGWRRILMGGPTSGAPGLSLSSAIIDKNWEYGLFAHNGITLFLQHNSTGPYTTFRDIASIGMYLQRFIRTSPGTTQAIDVKFEGVGGACIRLEHHSSFVVENGIGIQNGATANSDVGVYLVGPHCSLKLPSASNASGSLGEVRFSDGSIRTYNSIRDEGPFIDTSINFAEKA